MTNGTPMAIEERFLAKHPYLEAITKLYPVADFMNGIGIFNFNGRADIYADSFFQDGNLQDEVLRPMIQMSAATKRWVAVQMPERVDERKYSRSVLGGFVVPLTVQISFRGDPKESAVYIAPGPCGLQYFIDLLPQELARAKAQNLSSLGSRDLSECLRQTGAHSSNIPPEVFRMSPEVEAYMPKSCPISHPY